MTYPGIDLQTAEAIANTLKALSSSTELIAERVSQVDGRNDYTLRLMAALADRLERAAGTLAAHRAELDNLEARLEALEGRHDHTATAVIDHLTISHGQDNRP